MALTLPLTGEYHSLLRDNGVANWRRGRISWDEHAMLHHVGVTACFLKSRRFFGRVFLYEDLVGRPRETLGELLEAIGVPREEVDAAMGALEADSQKGQVTQFDLK